MPTVKEGASQAGGPLAATPATQAATPEPVTPVPGKGFLPRGEGESEAEHRGFLLWAMQAPAKRSYRLTARAQGVTDTSVRRWAERRTWAERVEGLTRSDALAWREWLATYAETSGLQGIATVQVNMDVEGPLTPLAYLREKLGDRADPTSYPKESVARSVLDAAADTSRRAMGDRLPEDEGEEEEEEEAKVRPNPSRGKDEIEIPGAPPTREHAPASREGKEEAADPGTRAKRVREFSGIVNATLAIYGQDVKHTLDPVKFPKGKEVRVTPKDVPLLIELAQALQEAPESLVAPGPIESVRIRIAREKGEDVLEALGHDHEEMGVILEGLRSKKAQEAVHLREELSRARGPVSDSPLQGEAP